MSRVRALPAGHQANVQFQLLSSQERCICCIFVISWIRISSVSVTMQRWRPCLKLCRPPWPSGRLVSLRRSRWSSTRPPPSSASSWRSRLQSCWRLSPPTLPLKRRLKQVWLSTIYMFRMLDTSKITAESDAAWTSRPVVCIFSLFFADVYVEPHKKQLHVTLAYHFHASHLPVLEKLAKNVDVCSGCDWLAVLYSRDIRFANHEVTSLSLTPSFAPSGSGLSLTLSNHITAADAARHVPIYASERRRAWADARRLHLHVACGAEQRERGLGVRQLAGHGAVGPAARELRQPSGRVGYLGRSWVRRRSSQMQGVFSLGPNAHRPHKRWHQQKAETASCFPVFLVPGSQVLLHSQLCLSIQLWLCRWVVIRRKAHCQSARQSRGGLQPCWPLPSDAGAAWLPADPGCRVAIIICCQEMDMVAVTSCLCQVTRTACQPSLSKMRLFVCRHGERMDVVFGKHWITQCFDSKGSPRLITDSYWVFIIAAFPW